MSRVGTNGPSADEDRLIALAALLFVVLVLGGGWLGAALGDGLDAVIGLLVGAFIWTIAFCWLEAHYDPQE